MKQIILKSLLGFFLVSISISGFSQEAVLKQAENISYDEFYEYLSVLAHDSLEGRETASPGMEKSAALITSKLEEFGLEPGGDNNSYLQRVPLFKTEVIKGKDQIKYLQDGMSIDLRYAEDITMLPYTHSSNIDKKLNIVHVGDGIVVPERGIDPYEGIDVKGKLVMLQINMPKAYKKDTLISANSHIERRLEIASEKGAEGVIFYSHVNLLEKMVFNSLHQQVASDYYTLNAENKQKQFLDLGFDVIALVKTDPLKEMFKQNDTKLRKVKKAIKKGKFKSFELAGDLQMKYEASQPDMSCNNIVAVLPGSDPVLKDEYIVVTAHLDHIGIGTPIKGDSIYNGAWDNASGSAGVLTLAHTFSELPEAPKRSVMFVWFTAEEKGLLGSNYFVRNPPVEKDQLKACVNQDMIGNLFDSDEFIAMGYEMSNASEAIDFAAKHVGMERDPAAEIYGRYFKNSDHYSFVQDGIPGIFFWGGMKPVGEEKRNPKIYQKWEKKHLHKPDDDLNQDFCEEAMVKGMKLGFLSSWYLANELEEVHWNIESEGYKKHVEKKD